MARRRIRAELEAIEKYISEHGVKRLPEYTEQEAAIDGWLRWHRLRRRSTGGRMPKKQAD